MSYEIFWDWGALATFYRLPPHSAALADRAVLRYAATGEGELESEPPYYILRAGRHDLMLTIDFEARVITVLSMLPRIP